MLKGKKSPTNVIVSIATYVAIFLPAAFGFLYVYLFGVNVPYGDTWTLVPLFGKLASGTLAFSDLWAQLWDHRIFIPRIAVLLVGSATKFDLVAVMYLIQVCYLAMLAVLLVGFRKVVGTRLYLFLPVPLLVFSPRQYWDMLQPISINLAFAQAFGLLTFYLLYILGRTRFGKLAFAGALASATVAAFSAANGLLVWPVGALQLLVAPVERSVKKLLVGLWSLLGLIEWVIYFLDYKKARVSTPLSYLVEHPVAAAEYLLELLGGSLFQQQGFALFGGLALFGLAMAVLFLTYRDRKWGEHSFWLALLLFSFLTLAAIMRGRLEAGHSTQSSYALFSIPVVIATYTLLVKAAFEKRSFLSTGLVGVLAGILLLGLPASYAEGIQKGRELEMRSREAAFVVSTYDSQPDAVLGKMVRRAPHRARREATTLKRLGYGVFSEPRQQRGLPPELSELSPLASSGQAKVSSINSVRVMEDPTLPIVVPQSPYVTVSGWALDPEAGDAADGVYLKIDGELFPAFYGLPRPGVAKRLNAESEDLGFRRHIPTSELETEPHTLEVITVSSDGEGYYRTVRMTFKIGVG